MALVSLLLAGCLPASIVETASSGACDGIAVTSEDKLPRLVISSPPGTTFCLRAGVHRLGRSITPKDGQAFLGEPGAVVSGAVTLDFAPAGATWVASGQTQESSPHGECAKGDACRYNEDVYFDDRLLTRVTARSELAPGRFFFDYDQDEIHIADDPAGHVVEGAVAPQFLSGDPSVSGVVVRGLVVEKFATPAQQGAVDAGGGTGWLVEGNEVRFNHGVGIIAATDGVVRANNVHHNGMQGVGGSGSDLLFEDNEIAYNNTAGFSPGWSASGAKFAHTTRLRVAGNFVHHNEGPGLWTDVSNIHTVYEDNVVEDNADAGIFHEISYDAVIRNNTVNRNGFGTCNWLYGAGILVAHSPNVEVYGNTVLDNCNGIAGIQQDRGSGPHGPHELRNLFVHDNLVRARDGITGVAVGDGDTSVYTNRNNRFRRNTYKVPRTAEVFGWMNHAMNRAEWQAAGQDTDGVFQDP